MRDDELEARVARALQDGLADGPVETGPLLAGARSGATRIRRRRRAVTATVAVAAVVSVPLGLDRAGVGPFERADRQRDVQVASPEPSGTTTTPTPPEPTAVTTFPDAAALQSVDFSEPMDLGLDLGSYPDVPTVDGQSCGTQGDPDGPRPVGGRIWSWDEAGSDRVDQLAVRLNLTAWQDAEDALQDVRRGTGRCTFPTPVTERPSQQAEPGASRWVASTSSNGLSYGHAAVQVGAVVVAVTVQDRAGEETAAAEADRLATAAVQRTLDALG